MNMTDYSKYLTIVLVLKDRASFTWRWMNYYNKVGLPYKVLIADGGKDKSVEKLADKSFFPNIDYEYIRYPYDKDIPTFLAKLRDVTSRVKTKYAILVDNDDIHLVRPLGEAVEFLEQNDDYIATKGEIYDFKIKPINPLDLNNDVYGKITGFMRIFASASNTEDTALGRVRIFSEFPDDLAHDVCRTEGLKHSCQILANSDIIDLQLSDNLMDYLLVTCGKVHRGSGLYMLHQCHLGGLGHALMKVDPFDWIMSNSWPEDISKMYKLIATEISNRDKISIDHTFKKVMQFYTCFIIGKIIIKGRLERKIAQLPPKIVTLGHIFSKNNPIRIFFKKLYLYIKERKEQVKSDNTIKSSPYHKELKEIKEFLLKKDEASD